MDEFLDKYFIIIFPLMWIIISLSLSKMSGWSALAKKYKINNKTEGKRWWFKSASIGNYSSNNSMLNMLFKQVGYGGVLMLRTNPTGLELSVLLPFRIGHPPIFIPWQDFKICEEKKFFRSVLLFNIPESGVTIDFGKRLGKKLNSIRGVL